MSSEPDISRSMLRRASGLHERKERKPSRRQRHLVTDQSEEYVSLVFKVAQVHRNAREKVSEMELQSTLRKAAQNFRLLSEQSLVDTFFCCSKLGQIDTNITNALIVELQQSLATLRDSGHVNPVYHSQVKQAAYSISHAESMKQVGSRVYGLIFRSIDVSLRSLHFKLCNMLTRMRDAIPRTGPTVVHVSDSTAIQEMRRKALQYQRHRPGGRVINRNTSEGSQRRAVAYHMPWLFEPAVRILDVLLVQLSAPSTNQDEGTCNPVTSTPKNMKNSNRYGFKRLFQEEQLVTMLKYLSSARYHESTLMDLIILHMLAQMKISVLTMHSIVEALYACSRMAHYNEDLVDQMLSALNKRDGWKLITSPDHACMFLWSLCVLGRVTPELLEQGAARMRQLGKRGGKLSSVHRRQLAQVHRQLELQNILLFSHVRKLATDIHDTLLEISYKHIPD